MRGGERAGAWCNVRCGGLFFFFNVTATTEIYTLSLHDALPIYDLFPELIADLCRNGFNRRQNHIARNSHKPALPGHLRDAGEKIRQSLQMPDPPPRKYFTENSTGRQALQFLIDAGEVVDVSPDLVLEIGRAHV